MKDLRIEKYTEEYKDNWNQFIANSKNGSFLFNRDYMEYHSDRFHDYSLMFFEENRLVALLPANIENDILSSHGGLTYGGFISGYNFKTYKMIEIFDKLKEYLKDNRIKKIRYKVIPYIYHIIPAEEDLYALYINGASLVRRDFSASIFLQEKFYKKRNKAIKNISKAIKNGLWIKRDCDYESFWHILEQVLRDKYNKKPVHSLEEIRYLAEKFPDNIKLYSVYKDNTMIAGSVIYESNSNVAHLQYQAISEKGKKYFALDYLYNNLTEIYQQTAKFLDFGSSIIRKTNLQNLNLLRYKESLGARIIHHDTYEIELT